MKKRVVYVNGSFVDEDKAKVSVFDSGFLLGDGIWEGLRLNKKKWVFFEDHIKRLFEALKLVEIKFEL